MDERVDEGGGLGEAGGDREGAGAAASDEGEEPDDGESGDGAGEDTGGPRSYEALAASLNKTVVRSSITTPLARLPLSHSLEGFQPAAALLGPQERGIGAPGEK